MSYCDWDKVSNICKKYHDAEWGIPVFDDRMQFEYLMMEVMQCGLSWDIVINKREIFRTCFDNFVPEIIAKYDEKNIIKIMNHQGMIKSKRKIEAVINNAKCFLKIQALLFWYMI